MDLVAASEALHARVRAFVSASMRGEPIEAVESFDALALELARFQAANVAPIARLVRARGVDLDAARSAVAIPAVPCDVLRLARVAPHAPELDALVFRTSGTSLGALARGEHALRTTATYEAVALAWGRPWLFPDRERMRTIVLAPPRAEAMDSSLGFMLELFARHLGGTATWHVRGGALDLDGVERACACAREDEGEPALVLGTSFAFVHLLDAAAGRALRLPAGSRVMQTGGFKGRSREVAADALRCGIARAFELPEASVVAEYGMTELSSQLYEGTFARKGEIAGTYLAPPWMRVTAVDPATLEPLADGEEGIARIVDLANVDSAVAIQTADRVRVHPSRGLESARVELLGRAPGASPRGCSIAIDDMLGGAAAEAR